MEVKKITSLPMHYERYLGQIDRGWLDENRVHGIQIVSFKNQPEAGVTTYATLGLGRHEVEMAAGKAIRQELLISANNEFSPDAIAGLLLSLAEHMLSRNRAFLRGEVIGPGNPVIGGVALSAIYVTNPSPFDSALTKFQSNPPATVFAYLIAITQSEATLVLKKGWRWFEDQLERQNPDIWNLSRVECIEV